MIEFNLLRSVLIDDCASSSSEDPFTLKHPRNAGFLWKFAISFVFTVTMNTNSLFFSFAPTLIDTADDAPRQFAGVAYSGGVIPGYGYFGDVAIDLSSLKAPTKPVFALVNHDTNQRAGKTLITNTGNSIEVLGSFSQSTAAGKQVAAEFSEGAPWEFSVGLQAEIETFKTPKTLQVNGQTVTIDALFKNASVREVSFVPAGADPHTQAVAFGLLTSVESTMDNNSEQLAAVSALNADLQVKLSVLQDDHAKVVADLQMKLGQEAKAHLEAVALANTLKDELNAFRADVRLNAVKALFSDLHREFSVESAQPYVEMNDVSFAAVSNDLRSLKPALKADYFKDTTPSGSVPSKSEHDFAAQLFAQVAGSN